MTDTISEWHMPGTSADHCEHCGQPWPCKASLAQKLDSSLDIDMTARTAMERILRGFITPGFQYIRDPAFNKAEKNIFIPHIKFRIWL